MTLLVVPNAIRDAIYAAIDKALDGRPCTDESREVIYGQILAYYDEYGRIPAFDLTPNQESGDEAARPEAEE